jgi:competence protein ComEC
VQSRIIDILRKNIPQKKECGLAEALLIGYKNDLDRSLLQAYSNTGVVHVVAISGLHLGLIFSILNYLCKPIKHSNRGRILRVVIILAGLWLFSLLAGGSPSVLRSAVMFSSIVIGEYFSKRPSIYNNLASSAFFLLCYDPYWLWDLGFILSYSALISIVLFMKSVYNVFIFKNKILDNIWKLNAVTIAAQILTMPVLLYYFKQFPNLFIITNFVAVPLSSIILLGELILCAIHFIQPAALLLGKLLLVLIKFLNDSVEYIDSLPYSTTNGLSINFLQMIVLYLVIGLTWYMFQGKHNHGRNFHFK